MGTAGCQTLIFLMTDPEAKDTVGPCLSPSFVSGHFGKRLRSLDLGRFLLRPPTSLSGARGQGQGFLVLPCRMDSLMQSPSQQVYLVAHPTSQVQNQEQSLGRLVQETRCSVWAPGPGAEATHVGGGLVCTPRRKGGSPLGHCSLKLV